MRFVLCLWFLVPSLPAFAASGNSRAIDRQGNIWSTGQNLLVALTPNAFQKSQAQTICGTQQTSPFAPPTAVSCPHAYVVKQDSSGKVLYATYLGGASADGGIAVTTDAQDNAYVTGFTYSPDFPVTAGVVQPYNAGPARLRTYIEDIGPFGPLGILPGGDVFVAKFAPDGTLLYSTLLGGSGSDIPALIGTDASGSVAIAGTTFSADFPVTPSALNHQSQSPAFFARLNPQASSLVYSTLSDPTIQDFDTDGLANVYVTGSMQPPTAIAGPYVTKIDTSSGRVLYSQFFRNLNPKIVGSGAVIAAAASGNVMLGVSPAPMPSPLVVLSPPVFPLGPCFLLMLAADGGSILAETDIGNSQFERLLADGQNKGNTYAFGRGTGALPSALSAPLLAAPCSSSGGEFVLEVSASGDIVAATYLRQGTSPAVINGPGALSVYRPSTQTLIPVDLSAVSPINFSCLVNLASGAVGPGIAPGQIFAVFGNNIGPAQAAIGAPDTSGRYPTSLSGTRVLINGTAAPLLFAQAGEIHGVVPFGFSPNPATVQIQYLGQNAPVLDEPTSYNPGIFTINGQAAVVNQDGTVNSPANPAARGSIVSIYATGMGPLSSPLPDGSMTPIPPPYFLVSSPQVTFAGVGAKVLFAGAAPTLIAGVNQINAQVPVTLPAGTNLAAVSLVLIPPGVFSPPAAVSVAP